MATPTQWPRLDRDSTPFARQRQTSVLHTGNVLADFLADAIQKDPSVAQARTLLRDAYGHSLPLGVLPALHEDSVDNPSGVCVTTIDVGTAKQPVHNRSKAGRKPRRRAAEHAHAPLPTQLSAVQPLDRRKRNKAPKRYGFDILLINSSGKPELLATLEAGCNASVVLNQEHHCAGSAYVDLQCDAKAASWTLVGVLAVSTIRDETSAGVAVAAKAGSPVGNVARTFDHSPMTSLGRLAAA